MKSRIHLFGAVALAVCALTLTLGLLVTASPQVTPVSAQRLQRAQAESCSFTNINVTAAELEISDTLPSSHLSRTLYFANHQTGVITISVALTNGTPISCHLWGGPALGRTEVATFEVNGEQRWLAYPVSVTHSSDTVVLTASEFISGLQYVTASKKVVLTFTQDVTGPVISAAAITSTEQHLHALGTLLYYTNTEGAEEFRIGGQSYDDISSLSHTTFSAADLGKFCDAPELGDSFSSSWWTDYCLNGLPDPGVLTATSYDYVGNSTPMTFTYEPDGTPPTSTITSQPASPRSTPVQLDWEAGDLKSGVQSVVLWYQQGITGTWSSSDITGTGTSGTFAAFKFPAAGLYRFASRATDNVGNVEAEPVVSETQVLYDAQVPRSQITEAVPQYSHTPSFTITWVATPTTSGLEEVRLWYRFNQGDWISTTLTDTAGSGHFIFDAEDYGGEGRYDLATRATSQAGKNEPMPEGSGDATVYYDHTITPPWGFQVQPAGWTNVNAFTATWVISPTEVSGIAGARYKLGETAPLSATDGITATDVVTTMGGITVTTDGEYPLWIWLYDRAGNVSHTTAVSGLLQYDGTPPTVVITAPEHISDTIFVVEWGSDAGVSGLRGYDLRYRVGGGAWQDRLTETTAVSETFILTQTDVRYTFHVTACDEAGNRASAEAETYVGTFRIYLPLVVRNYPPQPQGEISIVGDPACVYEPSVTLVLSASVPSGMDNVTQMRFSDDGTTWGGWEAYKTTIVYTLPHSISDLKTVHVQFRGSKGGISEPVSDRTYLLLDGGFEAGNWDITAWSHGGELNQFVSQDYVYADTYSALLGDPSYDNKNVPPGSAWAYQTIEVPDVDTPILSFWYRIFTYDVLWSENHNSYYDYFDVYLQGTNGQTLEHILRDGYTGEWKANTLRDLGWRHFSYDLSAYAGQTVRVYFANFNTLGATNDPDLNTYTYLDEITVGGNW